MIIDFLLQWADKTMSITLDTAPYLLFGFILAGILYVLVPANVVYNQLGHSGISAILKSILVGIPMPLCSCSVIPVAESMSKKGASKQAVVGFLISAPETGADSIALSWGLLGPIYAILRPLAAFFSAIIAALLVGIGDKPSTVRSESTAEVQSENTKKTCSSGCCSSTQNSTTIKQPNAFVRIFRYAFYTLMEDLWLYLVLGIILAGFLGSAIPQMMGDHTWPLHIQYAVMLVISLPMYICATSATPVAASLILAGISPGAALIMLTAGPASNVTTIGFVAGKFGWRVVMIYIASIAIVSIGFAVLMDTLFQPQIRKSIETYQEYELPMWVQWGSLAILLCSLGYVIFKKYCKPNKK